MIDFDPHTDQSVTCDIARDWPIEPESIDFVYASHVLEHLYHQDRDLVIMSIYDCLRPEGLLFARVPHWSLDPGNRLGALRALWPEWHDRLTHRRNPTLPHFDMISTGVLRRGQNGSAPGDHIGSSSASAP